MTDESAVRDWVDRYLVAWDSNDPDDIRDLFTADAEYRFHPDDDPIVGHDAIVAKWVAEQDHPGDHRFSWEPVAVDGGTAVVQARTVYTAGPAAGRDYDNLWVLQLAPDGRVSSFTEWYMERGAPR